MRIDLRTIYDPAAVDQTQKATKANPQEAQPSDSADVTADVRLSGLEAKVVSAPDIRQERVDQIRQQIASGTYSVSDEQLANAMLQDVLKQ